MVLYLKKVGFKKQIQKLRKKLKGKKVVLYGAGKLFECINENYGFDGINIIGVADKSFEDFDTDFHGFRKIRINDIAASGADYVTVSTLRYLHIIEDMEKTLVDYPQIKVIPLVDRPFLELLKEIWS